MRLRVAFYILILFLVLSSLSTGQPRAWYVHNQLGSDAFNGLSPVVGALPSGPKRTIAAALAAAMSGDTIVVARTAIPYGVASGEPSILSVTDKKLSLQSTGGSVVLQSLLEVAFSPNVIPTIEQVLLFRGGRFELLGGLRLVRGRIVGGDKLILGGTVTFMGYPSPEDNPSLDSPPAGYAESVNVEYVGFSPGARIMTGDELRGQGIERALQDLRIGTTTAVSVEFTNSVSMKGRLNVSSFSTVNLQGHTLKFENTVPVSHQLAGSIANGTMEFILGEPVTVNGNAQLPDVVATSDVPRTLSLNTFWGTEYSVRSIRVTGFASAKLPNALTIGVPGMTSDAVVNSGFGDLELNARLVYGNVVLNTPSVVIPSSGGFGARVLFTGPDALTIHGSIKLDVGLVLTNSDLSQSDGAFDPASSTNSQKGWGIIFFPDQDVTIRGDVTNSITVGGSIGSDTRSTNHGQIRFYKAPSSQHRTTITGSVQILAANPLSLSDDTAILQGMGSVIFGNDRGDVRIDGGITNSSFWARLIGRRLVNNGRVTMLQMTTARLGLPSNRVGPISQTSRAASGSGNGDIVLGGPLSIGDFFGTTITIGGDGSGGIVQLPNGSVDATIVFNSRVEPSANLLIGYPGGTVGKGVVLSSVSSSGSGATVFHNPVTEDLVVTGQVQISDAGRIEVTGIREGASVRFGSLSMNGGILKFTGPNSASLLSVGNVQLIGGTIDFGGGERRFIVRGAQNLFGGPTGSMTVINGRKTTLVFETPTPRTPQTIRIAANEFTWPGSLEVNNTAGLTDAVRFTGGSLLVNGKLSFLQTAFPYGVVLDSMQTIVLGDFHNMATVVTQNNGRVVLRGTQQEVSGAGVFGNLEVNSSGSVTFAENTGPLTSTLFLKSGIVYNSGSTPDGSASNVVFSNTTAPPTIVVDEGRFASGFGPTFQSGVHLQYIGRDKETSTELPPSDKLIDLTVATSTGRTPGKGIIGLRASITVNGKLTVLQGQTLLIGRGNTLTLKGDTAHIDGNIVSQDVADFSIPRNVLVLANPRGTTIVGSGILCDLLIASGSVGNRIDGIRALVQQFLGSDGAYGGGDDFDTITPAQSNGSIVFLPGVSSLTARFGVGFAQGTQLATLVTSDSGCILTLGGDLVIAGSLNHRQGLIELAGHDLVLFGRDHSIGGAARVVGPGTMRFVTQSSTTLTVTGSPGNLQANVEVDATQGILTIAPGGEDLTLAGSLHVTGTLNGIEIGDGRVLLVSGPELSLTSGSTIRGPGILQLQSVGPPLRLTGTGDLVIEKLTVASDVKLELERTYSALIVTSSFRHVTGNIDLGQSDVRIDGDYNRLGGTYAASSGFLVLRGTVLNQGDSPFAIANLRLAANAAATLPGQIGVITVSKTLDVEGLVDIKNDRTGNRTILSVADGTTVNYRSGGFTVSPNYLGTITLVAGGASGIIPVSIWPENPTELVHTFRVECLQPSDTIGIPGNRLVTGVLDLRRGVLNLGLSSARTLSVANGATIRRRESSSVVLRGGALLFAGSNIDVIYEPSALTQGRDLTSGPELPATIRNLLVSRSSNIANDTVIITSGVTIEGKLSIRNNLVTTETAPLTLQGDMVIALDSAFARATDPVTTFRAPLSFRGSAQQTLILPASGLSVGEVIVRKTPNSSITISGGSLTCTGTVTLTSGLIRAPSPSTALVLTNPANSTSQGFIRNVSAGDKSHVVGYVSQNLKIGNSALLGLNEFPVGDENNYRPVALTYIDPSVSPGRYLGVVATVSHVDKEPSGTVGLPIRDGIEPGLDLKTFPSFHWSIRADNVLQRSVVLALTAAGISSSDKVNLNDVISQRVKIIRRNGGSADGQNPWEVLRGQYDNIVVNNVPSVVYVGVVSLVPEGAIFTYGLRSGLFVVGTGIEDQNLPDNARLFRRALIGVFGGNTQKLNYSASSSNSAVAEAKVANDTLIVRGLVPGTATITVTAQNDVDGRISTSFLVTVSGVTAVASLSDTPTEFSLEQNFPNPFNPSTTIRFALPKEAPVTLVIYNMLGVPVRTLINGEQLGAANHQVTWDGKDDAGVTVPSGMYLYRITAGSFQATRKMTLLK